MISGIFLAVVAISIVAVGLALVFFVKNYSLPVVRILSIYILSLAIWTLAVNFLEIFSSDVINLFFVRLSFFAILSSSLLVLLFSREVAGRPVTKRVLMWLLLALAIGSVAVFSNLVVSSLSYSADGHVVPKRETGYIVFIVAVLYAYMYAHIVVFREWLRSRNNLHKTRLGVIFSGLVIGTVSGILTNVVLPNIAGSTQPARFAFISLTIWLVTLVYTIVKYRFISVRLVVARLLGYIFSISFLAAAYGFVVLGLFDTYVRRAIQDNLLANIIQTFIILALALSFAPLKKFFDKATRRLFYRDAYEPQKVSEEINEVLVAKNTPEGLSMGVAKVLRHALNVSYVCVHFRIGKEVSETYFSVDSPLSKEIKKQCGFVARALEESFNDKVIVPRDVPLGKRVELLDSINATSFFRVHRGRSYFGSIIVGHKRSGDGISQQDESMLRNTAGELAIAAQNALYVNDIKNFSQILEERVEEATAELKATNKKLRAMDQAKDEFISLTSHQLRTPLTTVKGYLSMLLDGDTGELTPPQRKLVEEAFNSSQRMVHLISDFLNISRIQTGKFMIELNEANLADILSEEIDLLRISASSRRMRLDYEYPENFPSLMIDEGKIRQVMMNFIDNAIYYSPQGSTIRIVLMHTAKHVEFRVIDQGIGVPRAEQHKLFTKFSRASNAKKQRPDGTGIGLFMAKKVVVALGGVIIFQSEEGKGSTFGFRLNRDQQT